MRLSAIWRSEGHFFLLAHLFLCAAAIRSRPSALIVVRFLVGSPRFNGAVWPVSKALSR